MRGVVVVVVMISLRSNGSNVDVDSIARHTTGSLSLYTVRARVIDCFTSRARAQAIASSATMSSRVASALSNTTRTFRLGVRAVDDSGACVDARAL
jgi:hypothetical protein